MKTYEQLAHEYCKAEKLEPTPETIRSTALVFKHHRQTGWMLAIQAAGTFTTAGALLWILFR